MESGSTGVIGVGSMGLAMVQRLRGRALPVVVRDVRGEREAMAERAGAQAALTPAALARACDVVIVAVVDAAETETVLFAGDGVAAGAASGSCVVLCPTIAPDSVVSLAARLDAIGIDWIEAPMSGGPTRAREGTMSLMVACRDAVFARHAALLAMLAEPVFRLGERAGDGARVKLVNNLLAAINLVGASEAIALAERVGLDPALALSVIERSSGQSWIGSDRMRRALQGEVAPQARIALLAKDSALALGMAQAAGLESPLGSVAAGVFANAVASGAADRDDSSLLAVMRSGRVRPPDPP